MADTLRGELLDFRVRGSEGWGTGAVRVGAEHVPITGKLLGVRIGDAVELAGAWHEHARYGRQFKVERCDVQAPASVEGVAAWLAARLPNVGERRARALVERFGVDGLWSAIEQTPDRLLEVEGITPARRDAIVQAYATHRDERDRMIRLRGWGLTDGQISRLAAIYGDDAEAQLRADPYRLIVEVHGFGWERADALARKMGLASDHPGRIDAGLRHVVREAASAGHCYVPRGKLIAVAARKVLRLTEQDVAGHVERSGGKVPTLREWRGRLYLARVAEAEERAAGRLREMLKKGARDAA